MQVQRSKQASKRLALSVTWPVSLSLLVLPCAAFFVPALRSAPRLLFPVGPVALAKLM